MLESRPVCRFRCGSSLRAVSRRIPRRFYYCRAYTSSSTYLYSRRLCGSTTGRFLSTKRVNLGACCFLHTPILHLPSQELSSIIIIITCIKTSRYCFRCYAISLGIVIIKRIFIINFNGSKTD